jgi:hypothetical protein
MKSFLFSCQSELPAAVKPEPNNSLAALRMVAAAAIACKEKCVMEFNRAGSTPSIDWEDVIDMQRDTVLRFGGMIYAIQEIERLCQLEKYSLMSKSDCETFAPQVARMVGND